MSNELDFALIGGHPCLDFVNTEGGTSKARDVDRLPTFDDAIKWARVAGVVNAGEERTLRGLAKENPADSADRGQRLRDFRHSVYKVLVALTANGSPDIDALSRVEGAIKAAFVASTLDLSQSEKWAWVVGVDDVGVDVIRHRIAFSMNSLLTSNDRFDIGVCEACSWLFLDASPTKRRRWCSMAACGNRAKARRHYHGRSAKH